MLMHSHLRAHDLDALHDTASRIVVGKLAGILLDNLGIDMCVDMCMGMCVDMCMDRCMDVYGRVCGHEHGHVYMDMRMGMCG